MREASLQLLFFMLWFSIGLCHSPRSGVSSVASQHFLTTPLDHFGENNETWTLTYYLDNGSFKTGNSLIIVMPSESALSDADQAALNMDTQAPWAHSLNASVVTFEHRLFGRSVPKNGKSLQENYKYLTVEQSLKDAVFLIDHLHSTASYDHVVAVGGSYPGALAAWIRRIYPEKVDAAIAQSPVVHAFMDFPQYGISNLVALSSPDSRCAYFVSHGMQALKRLYKEDKQWLFQKFNQSALLHDPQGDFTFMWSFLAFTDLVQEGRKSFVCSVIAAATRNYAFQGVSDKDWAEVMSSAFFDVTNHRFLPFETLTPNPWWWLKCTQLGWFKTGPQSGFSVIPFENLDVDSYLGMCKYLFPNGTFVNDAKIADFNHKFGGAEQKNVSRVFTIDFSDDPWKMATTIGIVERQNWALGEEQPFMLLTCDGCSHCGDGAPQSAIDQISDQVKYYLSRWLKDVTASTPVMFL